MSDVSFKVASQQEREQILAFVRDYHVFEGIVMTEDERWEALRPLLNDDGYGCIWLIYVGTNMVGYIAVCFGYSIEFKGRDAFIDELFIAEAYRGLGVGQQTLSMVKQALQDLGVKALHLEVARDNTQAKRLYSRLGFVARERFQLMSQGLQQS